MGITGLLPMMKGASTEVKLEKLKGTVAAIDTNGWIHRACYNCGDKIYMNEPTEMYINYCVNYCNLLREHSITPILVFDGQSLPAKADTKLQRQKRKQAIRETIEELLRTENSAKARYLMRTCVDVTFELVRNVIVRCREEGIDCLVAPFEADAQISYLVNCGIADYAISEDSDMLVFGCRSTLYKLDRESTKGRMVKLDRLGKCFKGFEERRFQFMCILSGCDYLSNLPSVGMGRARKFFENVKAVSFPGMETSVSEQFISDLLKRVPTVLNMVGKVKVTSDYISGFIRAVNTFDHQLVYCPIAENLTHLKPLVGGLEKHRKLNLGQYAGEFFPNNDCPSGSKLTFITNYILGNVHTKTLELIDEYDPFEVTFTPKPTTEEEEKSSEPEPKEEVQKRDSIWFSSEIIERINSKRSNSGDGPISKKDLKKISEEEEEEPDSIPESPLKEDSSKKSGSKSWKRNCDVIEESPIKNNDVVGGGKLEDKEEVETSSKKTNVVPRKKLNLKRMKIDETKIPEDNSSLKMLDSIKIKLNRKLNQENNIPKKKIVVEVVEEEEEEEVIVEKLEETKIIDHSVRVTRSRNIFRKVDSNSNLKNESSRNTSKLVKKSRYFSNDNDDDDDNSTPDTEAEIEMARKAISATELTNSEDSDFEEEFADFIVKRSSTQAMLNTSASSIDDEDVVILRSLNGSTSQTSSGYCSSSQTSTLNSSQQRLSSSNAFTKLKQFSPQSSSSIKKSIKNSTSNSKNSDKLRRSSSNDIRNFFTATID